MSSEAQAEGCRLAWARRKTIERNHAIAVDMIDKWLSDGGQFNETDIKCVRHILTADLPDMMREISK